MVDKGQRLALTPRLNDFLFFPEVLLKIRMKEEKIPFRTKYNYPQENVSFLFQQWNLASFGLG